MKIDQIKKQLAAFDKKPAGKKEERPDNAFKPKIGKQTIRIVPNKYNPDDQFQALKIYYGIGKYKVMASPSNWDEKDPIEAFIKELRSTNNKENYFLSKKIEAKTRYYTPVIDRSEGEDANVRLWAFGKQTYQELLTLADDEEIGDYTDISEGRDLKLTTVGPEVTNTDYNKTTISPSLSSTPLHKDKKLVKFWLDEQPNPLDQFKRFTFDEVKESLKLFLTPTDEIGEDQEDVVDEMPKEILPKNKNAFSLKEKSSKTKQFDDLFDENDEVEVED